MALILSDRNQKVYIKSTNPAIFSCVIHWRSCVQKIKTFHGLVFFKYCFNCLKFTKNEILRKTHTECAKETTTQNMHQPPIAQTQRKGKEGKKGKKQEQSNKTI